VTKIKKMDEIRNNGTILKKKTHHLGLLKINLEKK